jgi:Flp pilus assembly protein TadD
VDEGEEWRSEDRPLQMRKNLIIGVVCVVMPLAGSSATARQQVARIDPRAAFAKGQAALNTGELDGAEKFFRQVLSVDPQSAAAYANLGVIAMRRKDWEHALTLLKKAEQLDPRMSGVRLNVGIVEFRRANYGGAIAPLRSVVREQPDSAQARYLLGLCEVLTEHYGEAVTELEPLWPERSNDAMYLYVVGIAAHNSGQSSLDEKALARLIEVGGDTPELHLILGKAYLNRQENAEAIKELNLAAARDASLPFVHFNLGMAHARLGDDDALAEAEFRKDIEIEPDVADDYAQLGLLYVRDQKKEEAERAFEEALRREPRMATARLGLAQLYFGEKKFALALREADAAVRLAPDNQNVHYLRGRILTRLGRQSEARTELATAQKLMNQSLGKARENLGDRAIPNPELTREPK